MIGVRRVVFDGRIDNDKNAPWKQKGKLSFSDALLGIQDIVQNGKHHRMYSVDFCKDVGFLCKPSYPGSTVVLYVSAHGNLCKKEYFKDGVLHAVYRCWKPNLSKEEKGKLRFQLFESNVDAAEIFSFTEPIGQWVLDRLEIPKESA